MKSYYLIWRTMKGLFPRKKLKFGPHHLAGNNRCYLSSFLLNHCVHDCTRDLLEYFFRQPGNDSRKKTQDYQGDHLQQQKRTSCQIELTNRYLDP